MPEGGRQQRRSAMLSLRCLPALAARGIHTPAYLRSGLPGVVHLGLGAFHRAHQALVFDDLLRRGDARWGVLGVAMRNTSVADTLAAQDGLYSVQLASSAGASWQVGGAIWRTCVATREPQQVVQTIAAASTRWITVTVTEKGYQPALAALLVQGLAQRRNAGLPGLTIASCDNLADNGRKLQALCAQAARQQHGDALADWVATVCCFPNSVVDRIVPAVSATSLAAAEQALGVPDRAAVCTEQFWEWVVERRFVDPSDAQVLATVGVTVVDNVAPFQEAKLRLLNGSHSAMACIGAVAGLPVISDCIAVPAIGGFIHGLMTDEVGPQLQRPDWPAYRDALLARFANPALQHSVHQIATDSSQKIPQRWAPAVRDALRAGLPITRLAFGAAAWMRYCRGVDEAGRAYALSDPHAESLQTAARRHAGDSHATFDSLGRLPEVWGDVLPQQGRWRSAVIRQLEQISAQGILAAAGATAHALHKT